MEPVTVTTEGARQALGIGLTKLYELIRSGKLEKVTIAGRTLITVASINRLVDEAVRAAAEQREAA